MAKGRKTGGGSRKGRPNTSTLRSREALWTHIHQQQAQGHRANPYEMLVHLMITSQDERVVVQCAKELAMYLLPKLTAVKLSGDADEPVRTVYQVDFLEERLTRTLERTEQLRRNGHQEEEPHA